jgi:hypothetical protein
MLGLLAAVQQQPTGCRQLLSVLAAAAASAAATAAVSAVGAAAAAAASTAETPRLSRSRQRAAFTLLSALQLEGRKAGGRATCTNGRRCMDTRFIAGGGVSQACQAAVATLLPT